MKDTIFSTEIETTTYCLLKQYGPFVKVYWDFGIKIELLFFTSLVQLTFQFDIMGCIYHEGYHFQKQNQNHLFMLKEQGSFFKAYMWHDQGEWVGYQEYWFWVTG